LLDLIAGKREAVCKAIVPMAADPVFSRLDRIDSRRLLGLPIDIPLVGYCGSLYRNRGIDSLFEAMRFLSAKHPDMKIVFSGRRQKGLVIPLGLAQQVIELGYLADERMPVLLNAMDVLLVINRPSEFGNHSYPAKLYEAIQCGVPVIATATKGTEWILRDRPECLVAWDNPMGLAEAVSDALHWGRMDYANTGSWEESARLFALLLESGGNEKVDLGTHPR
jgi:glycosyltransferase involved in cell wall biosynthesis